MKERRERKNCLSGKEDILWLISSGRKASMMDGVDIKVLICGEIINLENQMW